MTYEVKRVDDFIAEQIEKEAARRPPSLKAEKEALMDHARLLRSSANQKMIKVRVVEVLITRDLDD